jgi:hypothetical protein
MRQNSKTYREFKISTDLLLRDEKSIVKRCALGLSLLGGFFLITGFVLFFIKDVPLWASATIFTQGLLTLLFVNCHKIGKCFKKLIDESNNLNHQNRVILTTIPGVTFLKPETINTSNNTSNASYYEQHDTSDNEEKNHDTEKFTIN